MQVDGPGVYLRVALNREVDHLVVLFLLECTPAADVSLSLRLSPSRLISTSHLATPEHVLYFGAKLRF